MSHAEQIKKLQEEINALRAADERFAAMPEEQKLATNLHSMLCRWNHTDGCSWEYEKDWLGYAHGVYLAKAQMIMHFCNTNSLSTDKAIDLVKIIQAI
jgi:hypothetical protein